MSIKQDSPMVRTATDLEKKYDLAGMKRAIKLVEDTLTRTNRNIEEFVNLIIGSLESFEGTIDGQIVTHFYNGVPNLNTYPANTWEDSLENHIEDLYYDRDNGKVYTFKEGEETFEWVLTEDTDKIRAMAIANATIDTKDNFRRIFVEQPKPPYDNGDLWLKMGEVYACQISKPITEEYEEHDFILASSYAGDVVSLKVGNELQVLKGTVLKVTEDADFFRAEIENLDNNNKALLEAMENKFRTLIKGAGGQSVMIQGENGWEFSIESILESLNTNASKVSELEETAYQTESDMGNVQKVITELEKKTTRIRMGTLDGEPCIELGAEGSAFRLIITNTKILFMEGTEYPAYMTNQTMVIGKANIEKQLQVGSLSWVKRANNHISFMGVTENVGL